MTNTSLGIGDHGALRRSSSAHFTLKWTCWHCKVTDYPQFALYNKTTRPPLTSLGWIQLHCVLIIKCVGRSHFVRQAKNCASQNEVLNDSSCKFIINPIILSHHHTLAVHTNNKKDKPNDTVLNLIERPRYLRTFRHIAFIWARWTLRVHGDQRYSGLTPLLP